VAVALAAPARSLMASRRFMLVRAGVRAA